MSKHTPNSDAYEEQAVSILKSKGHRITMPRILVIRTLAESDRSLTANEVHQKVEASGGRMDLVSVYRTLALLVEAHMVHYIGIVNGYAACQLGHEHGSNVEHAICRSCGRIEEIDVLSETVAETFERVKKVGYQPLELKIEILGLCKFCSTA